MYLRQGNHDSLVALVPEGIFCAGAHRSWFHLYRLIVADQNRSPESYQETATILEKFLQTASLGEFERRLDMLATFRLLTSQMISIS